MSLSTPRLWSRLHIVEPTSPELSNSPSTSSSSRRLLQLEAKVTQRLEVINTWLRRSGQCPLTISLEGSSGARYPHFGAPVPPTKTDLFINTLLQFASRWQNIRLVAQPSALETLSRLSEDDVPLLKQLEIIHCFEDSQSANVARWSLSQSGVLHAPTLSTFLISGSHTKSTDLPLRWNQLTTLSLVPPWGGTLLTCQMVFDILSRCLQLESCKMLVHEPPNEHLADSIVDCPSLHTLEVQSVGAPIFTFGLLLSRLWLPELRDFTLRGQEDHRTASTVDTIVSSLAASPHLESISIDSDAFTKSSLMDFLRGLRPSVKHLHITEPVSMWQTYLTNPALDDDVLVALGTHCPTLQELVLLHCYNVSDEGLLYFIISRNPALKRIEVKFDREKLVDILPSLQSLVSDGLESSVTYKATLPPQFSPWQGLPDAPPQPQPGWTPWSAY